MNKSLRKILPLFFIFLVWLVFATPYFIQNKTPFPSTHLVNRFAPWNAYEYFWQPMKNDAMPDIISQIYPWRIFSIDSLKKGEIPLWNPYSFSGTPHLANYQSSALSPFNLLFFFLENTSAWALLVLIQPLLAGFFTYIFARSLKMRGLGAAVSSISFMFCGFITTWMGYATLAYAIVFLPLALFSVQKFFETKKIIYLLFLSASIPLSFFSGHFQTSLYFLIFCLLFVCFKFLQTRDRKSLSLSLIFIFFGLLISAPQIIPSMELYSNAVRSNIFLKIGPIPLFHFPTLFSPDYFGNPVTRNNILGNYSEWSSYAGILALFFALYVAVKDRRGEVIFFSLIGALSLFLAFDTPILDFLISLKLPAISTSPASRIIVLFSFAIAILSGFGIEKILDDLKKKRLNFYVFFSFSFLLIFLVLFLYSNKFNHQMADIAKRNLVFPVLIFLTGAISIFFVRLNKKFLLAISLFLIILISFDMLRFTKKWQPFDPRALVFPQTSITSYFPNITSFFRVFGNFGAEVSVYYHLPSVAGYDALYIERYGKFLSSIGNGKISNPPRSGVVFENRGDNSKKAVDLLGIKYILYKGGDKGKIWGFPFSSYPAEKFKKIAADRKYQIYENTTVFPRAFFVSNYTVQTDDQKIINKMFSDDFNLKESAVLEKDPKIAEVKNFEGLAIIKKYGNNKIQIETNINSAAVLILTDNYYPGWIATIDGKQTLITRADYTFRGVSVPKGKHIVVFSYEPKSARLGLYLGLVGILGIIYFLFLGQYLIKQKRPSR